MNFDYVYRVAIGVPIFIAAFGTFPVRSFHDPFLIGISVLLVFLLLHFVFSRTLRRWWLGYPPYRYYVYLMAFLAVCTRVLAYVYGYNDWMGYIAYGIGILGMGFIIYTGFDKKADLPPEQ